MLNHWFRFGKNKQKSAAADLSGLSEDALFHLARTEDDPLLRLAAIKEGLKRSPDHSDWLLEKLLLGRLPERDPKRPSLHVIKCYLLHAFEHPEAHPYEERERMIDEIFHHPDLVRCLELAKDKTATLRRYLDRLSGEYMRVFVMGDSAHTPSLLGLTRRRDLPQYMAKPACDIIHNIFLENSYTETEQRELACAFYRAYRRCLADESAPLDRLLGPEVAALLNKPVDGTESRYD